MTTFFLIRHASCRGLGHTLWGRTPGICLNQKGKLEAQQLAERFREIPLRAVYSSPLERAVETAEALARALKIEVRQSHAFNEIDFGDWTGKSFDVLGSDDCWRRFNSRREETAIPGGEAFSDVQRRAVTELHALRSTNRKAKVAIVSHADVIRAIVGYFTAIPVNLRQRIEISPCSVSIIAMVDDCARLLTINNRPELDQLGA